MLKVKTQEIFKMITDALADGGKTREELYEHFKREISSGTISARCNDLLKVNRVKQKRKRKTKSGCYAFILENNYNMCEWLPYDALDHMDIISDEQISNIIKIFKKATNRKDIIYSLIRATPRKKLKKLIGACRG